MMNYSTKCITILLNVISAISLINVSVIYWLPINLSFSSFSAVKLTVVALINKQYYLILVSILICVLMFLTTISIRRQHILLPAFSLLHKNTRGRFSCVT